MCALCSLFKRTCTSVNLSRSSRGELSLRAVSNQTNKKISSGPWRPANHLRITCLRGAEADREGHGSESSDGGSLTPPWAPPIDANMPLIDSDATRAETEGFFCFEFAHPLSTHRSATWAQLWEVNVKVYNPQWCVIIARGLSQLSPLMCGVKEWSHWKQISLAACYLIHREEGRKIVGQLTFLWKLILSM